MFKLEIPRRKSRQIMVGNVAVGGDAPIRVQTMTNTETTDVEATLAQIGRAAGRCGHRARVRPQHGSGGSIRRDQKTFAGAADHRHPFRLQDCPARGGAGRGLPAHQPRQYRARGPRAGGGAVGEGPWHSDPHRRQRRFAGKGIAKKIRRADAGCAGGIGLAPYRDARQAEFPGFQGQPQGLRSLHDGGGVQVSPARSNSRCTSALPKRAVCAPAA